MVPRIRIPEQPPHILFERDDGSAINLFLEREKHIPSLFEVFFAPLPPFQRCLILS